MRVRPFLLLFPALLAAQSLQDFEKKVTKFQLPNGLTFLIVERHEAPVVSFHTYVNVGSVDDPTGRTGLAHMFEHMAFKGTDTIGTKNWPAEKAALAKVEAAYDAYLKEREKRVGRDEQKVKQLETAWQEAIKQADQYVIRNQYTQIIEDN